MNVDMSITADRMIAEFLKAELHSSRFRAGSLKALSMLEYREELIENPNYDDEEQNVRRAKVLKLCRGWPDEGLFTNFPTGLKWHIGTIDQNELSQSYRLKSSGNMTDGERLLSETVKRLKKGGVVNNINPALINQIILEIEAQKLLPPIILVGENFKGKKVLVEGHSRSIAYVYVDKSQLPEYIPVIIGLSTKISEWQYF